MKKILLSVGLLIAGFAGMSASAATGGVMTYDANYNPPIGYVKIVNDTGNPTEMIIIQKNPGDTSYDFSEMQAFTPDANYAIPSRALKNTLLTTNGTSTWVVQGNDLENPGNRADWVSNPADAGDGDYELMTTDGDGGGISFIAQNTNTAKIRLIYTGPSFQGFGCVNYSGASFIGAVVLDTDGTAIGCNRPGTGDEDLIPLGGIRADWVTEFQNEWEEFTTRLGFGCDDCWMGSDGDNGSVGIPLGFDINYYGTVYDNVFVNSNGSVSFGQGSSEYDQPLDDILGDKPGVCAYCLDIENDEQIDQVVNSATGWHLTGSEWRHSDFTYRGRTIFEGRPAFVATWINIPTYSSDDSDGLWNTFQIMFVDVDDTNDDVDIIVNYGSMMNEDDEGYCDPEDGSRCNLVAIGLGTASGDLTIYNSIVNDSGLELNGLPTDELRDNGINPLNEMHLNSTIPGRFIFHMEDGQLPGSTLSSGPGCTDEDAVNYDSYAASDDGTCAYHVDNLTAINAGLNEISIEWTHALSGATSDLQYYNINYNPGGSGAYTGILNTTTGITLTGLSQSTTYTIEVCSVYSIGGDEIQACTSISKATTTPASSGGGGGGGTYSPNRANILAPISTTKTPEPEAKPVITDTKTPNEPIRNTISFPSAEIYNPDIPEDVCYERKDDITIYDSNSIQTSEEFKKALTFLSSYGMTIFNSVDDFKIEESMTRAQAAKMLSNFATNVLCRKPDQSTIAYKDIENTDSSLTPFITLAFQLGLMKGGADSTFRPNDIITKAELNAVLTRMILKSYLPEDNGIWYQSYNDTATKLGIITQGAKEEAISRNDAALMLFRAYRDQAFSLQNLGYETFVIKDRDSYIKN